MNVDLKKEIERLKRENKQLRKKIGKDSLTGLMSFQSDLGQDTFKAFFDRCSRETDTGPFCWLVFVDLLKFKNINDNCGHNVGDIVLKSAAEALGGVLRSYDIKALFNMQGAEGTFTRAGGDEFILGLENVSRSNLETVFLRIINSYAELIKKEELEENEDVCSKLGFNFGVASFDILNDGDGFEEWLKLADDYMYKSKEFSHSKGDTVSSFVIDNSTPQIL